MVVVYRVLPEASAGRFQKFRKVPEGSGGLWGVPVCAGAGPGNTFWRFRKVPESSGAATLTGGTP